MNTIHYIIVGAKSPQGRQTIRALAERGLETKYVTAIDTKAGSMSYGEDATITVGDPSLYKTLPFRKTAQMVLADAKPELIDLADDHLDDGARLLDLTGHFLGDPDAVLAPEDGMLVVQPSSAAQMIREVVSSLPAKPATLTLTVLLPASHFGKDGMDELYQQVRQFLVAEDLDNSVFPKKLAFNVLPYAGVLGDDGVSTEETRLYAELAHLIPDTKIVVNAVIVPVFIGVSIQAVATFDARITASSMANGLRRNRQLRVIDPQSDLVAASPAEITGDDLISISRIYTPQNRDDTLCFWITGDNTVR